MKSSTQCARNCVKYIGHNEDETSKDYSVNLPSVHPPDKSKSRSPRLDDPATPRRVAPARMSKFPTASRRMPRHHPCTCIFPAKKQTRPKISRVFIACAFVRAFRPLHISIRLFYRTNRKQTLFCDETSMITFVTLISNSSKLEKSIERARDPHSLRRPNV